MAREVTDRSKSIPAARLLALALGPAAFGAVAIGALWRSAALWSVAL
jgi:hypothetical protein